MVKGKQNGNWKGGLTTFKTADELLSLSVEVQGEIRKRLRDNSQPSDSGCLVWTGRLFSSNGRACLTLGRRNHGAHRLAFALAKGFIGEAKVLHTCDNVICINPDHLWLGTSKDNSKDMVAKGRQAKGEKNARSILTQAQVDEIRRRVAGRRLYGIRKALAKEFGVNPETISRVINNHNWK